MKRTIIALVSLMLAALTAAPAQASTGEDVADVRLDDSTPVSPGIDAVRGKLRAEREASGERLRADGIDRYGFLMNENGTCLDVESPDGVLGTRIIHFECHWGNNQLWKFTEDPDPARNQWEIKPVLAEDQCVDVFDDVGPDLLRYECHLGANQLWGRSGRYWVSHLNGHVLDASGTDIRALAWPYLGQPNQRWVLVEV